jgi:hypothetical protein
MVESSLLYPKKRAFSEKASRASPRLAAAVLVLLFLSMADEPATADTADPRTSAPKGETRRVVLPSLGVSFHRRPVRPAEIVEIPV